MADRDLTINLKLLKTQADQAAKDFHAAEKQRVGKTLSDHDIAEKAKTAIIQREIRQRIQAIVSAHKTEIDLEKEKERAARAGNQAINVALRAAAAEEKRIKREQANEEARLLRELAARHKANYRERQKEKKEQAAETKRLLKEEKDGWDAQGESILAGAKAVGTFALGMAGLNSASAIVGEIEAGFQRARDAIYNSTNLLHDYRESLLELAALKDHMGDTSAEMIQTLALQAKTGQKREDVQALQTAFIGIGETAIGKKITQAEATKAMEGVGRLQAVEGGSAEAYGKLGGLLLQTMTPKNGKALTGEEVAREAAATYQLTRPGGFQTMGSAVEQFGKTMPFVRSGVMSGREAMALTSAFSIAEEGSAGTRTNQLVRATIGSLGRDRRVRGPEGSDHIGTATYLKSLGATEGMGVMDIVKLVNADLAKQRAAADAKGAEFSPYKYLQGRGYGATSELNALINMGGMISDGTFGKFETMQNDANLGAGLAGSVQDKLRTEVTFQQRMSKAAEQTAKLTSGAGKNELLTALRRAEYAKMRTRDPGMREFDELETSSPLSLGGIYDAMMGRSFGDVNFSLEQTLMSQAKQHGVPFQLAGALHMSQDEQYRVARELQSRGVDLIGQANQSVNSTLQGKLQDAGMLGGGQGGQAALNQAAQLQLQAAKINLQAAQLRQPKRASVMAGKPSRGLPVQAGQQH